MNSLCNFTKYYSCEISLNVNFKHISHIRPNHLSGYALVPMWPDNRGRTVITSCMLLVSYIQLYFNTSFTVLTKDEGLKVTDCTVQSAEYWCSYGKTVLWSRVGRTWLSRGSCGVYMAVTGSLCGCYGVYSPLFCENRLVWLLQYRFYMWRCYQFTMA